MRSGYFIDCKEIDNFFQICHDSVLVGLEIKGKCEKGSMPPESEIYDSLSSRISPENIMASLSLLQEFGCIEKDMITGHFYNITEFGRYMLSESVSEVL